MELRKEIDQADPDKARRYAADLYQAWFLLLVEAWYEVRGGMHHVIGQIADSMFTEATKKKDREDAELARTIKESFIKKGEKIGESGKIADNVNGAEIINKVKARLEQMNIPVPGLKDPIQVWQEVRDAYKRAKAGN